MSASVSLSTDSGATEDLQGTVVVSALVLAVPAVLVTRIRFYVNDELAATVESPPYEFSWDTTLLPNGPYQLRGSVSYSPRQVTESKLDVSVLNLSPVPLPDPPVEERPVLMEE